MFFALLRLYLKERINNKKKIHRKDNFRLMDARKKMRKPTEWAVTGGGLLVNVQ